MLPSLNHYPIARRETSGRFAFNAAIDKSGLGKTRFFREFRPRNVVIPRSACFDKKNLRLGGRNRLLAK